MIVLEPNLTDEQIIALHQCYKEEMMARKEQLSKHHKLNEWKQAAEFFRSDVLKQMRSKIVSSKKSHHEEKS